MKTYQISVDGCDDSTIIEMELTEEEYTLIKRIADKVTETSSYQCEPKMFIHLLSVSEDD